MRAYIHNGRDWSTRHWPIALTASVMPFKSGIIDGEVVALDDQHRSCSISVSTCLNKRAEPIPFTPSKAVDSKAMGGWYGETEAAILPS